MPFHRLSSAEGVIYQSSEEVHTIIEQVITGENTLVTVVTPWEGDITPAVMSDDPYSYDLIVPDPENVGIRLFPKFANSASNRNGEENVRGGRFISMPTDQDVFILAGPNPGQEGGRIYEVIAHVPPGPEHR